MPQYHFKEMEQKKKEHKTLHQIIQDFLQVVPEGCIYIYIYIYIYTICLKHVSEIK